ncbi:MAG TPA: trypsin-like peptidase domain-containing protein [bacterium]
MLRLARWSTLVLVVVIALEWPASAMPPLQTQALPTDHLHQFLEAVTVRIDIDLPDRRGICTGWVGWTEPERSAVYTAAHCYQPDGKYRATIGGRDSLSASGVTKWDAPDLMVLWIARGNLPILWSWKPLPTTPFRALYMLYESGSGSHLVEVDIPRIYREIRFKNDPASVALPLTSHPGTSGAPIIDAADGALVGMVVGFLENRPDISAVIPAQTIYKTLVGPPP